MARQAKYGLASIVRGGFWLYGVSLVNNVGGFLYWIIMSRITPPQALGITSAIIGVAQVAVGLLSLGMADSFRRMLGESIGRGDEESLARYYWTGFSLLLFLHLAVSSLFLVAGLVGYGFSKFAPLQLAAIGLLVLVMWPTIPVTSLFTALIRTEKIFLASLLGLVAKLAGGIILVFLGYEWLGVYGGYALAFIVTNTMLVLESFRLLGYPKLRIDTIAAKALVRAGLVVWFPTTITLLGQWLGVLAVYASSGAAETGYYYIAQAIANFMNAFTVSIMSVALPVITGTSEEKDRMANKVMLLTSFAIAPLSIVFILTPGILLGILGQSYIAASDTLRILLFSTPALVFSSAVQTYVYATGLYRATLGIGLAQNLPRIILYVLLSWLGGLGAAIAYTSGAYAGAVAAYVAARQRTTALDMPRFLLIFTIPALLGLAGLLTGSPVAIIALTLASYPLYHVAGLARLDEALALLRQLRQKE